MSSGFAELDSMIESLRALPKAVEEAADDSARALETVVRKQIAAGTTAEGKAWKPRAADGGQPLQEAAKALYVAAVGPKIIFRLTGHIARHHRGRVRGGEARPILPIEGLPPAFASVIRAALERRVGRTLAGGAS